MKRVLLLLLAMLVSFGVAIKASADARLNSMSANIYQVEDIDSIFLYANKVLDYKNTVDFRLNNTTYYDGTWDGGGYYEWGGIIHDMGTEFGTLAVYVNRPTSSAFGSLSYNSLLEYYFPSIVGGNVGVGGNWLQSYWYSGQMGAPTNNNLDLIWANKLEGFGNLGIHFNYADYSPGNWFSSPYLDFSTLGLSVGLGIGEFAGFKDTSLHLGFEQTSGTDSQAATPVKDTGIFSITAGALASSELDSSNTLRLALDTRFDQTSLPGDWEGGGYGMDAQSLVVMLGSSMIHKISDKGFVHCGFQAEYMGGKDPYNAKINQYVITWNGSVESAMNSWLTVRAGIEKTIFARAYWESGSWGDPSVDYSYYNDYVQFNLGASINVENWNLDVQVDPSSFEDAINNPAPGAGIMYYGGYNSNGGVLSVMQADLRYKF